MPNPYILPALGHLPRVVGPYVQTAVDTAAELGEQAVVAAAAAHRALGTEPVGDPLEHGEVVVVHAADQARVE